MMQNELSEYLTCLEKVKASISSLGDKLLNDRNRISVFETFCIGILNRSLNLVDGFIMLSKTDNFITAFAIVRIHLDTLLRFYAICLTNRDLNVVVEEILICTPIYKLKDGSTNKYLNDTYLKDKLSDLDNFKWVKDTYETSSGFIHFSVYILRASNLSDETKMTINHSIKIGSDFILENDKIIACAQMIKISEGIIGFINERIDINASKPTQFYIESQQ